MNALTISLMLARLGRGPLMLAAAAALAATVWGLMLPAAERESARQQHQLASLRQEAPKVARSPTPQLSALQAFEKRLTSAEGVSSLQRQLWQQAATSGLQLSKVDYHNEADTGTQFTRLSITLPVTGPYPAVRRFIFALMAQFPGLSLDKLDLKRSAIAGADVEATMHLTLLVRP